MMWCIFHQRKIVDMQPEIIWEFEKLFKKGDTLIFSAFGAGFTWGSLYYKWAYDGAAYGK